MPLILGAVLLVFAAIPLDAEVLPTPPRVHHLTPRAEGFIYSDDPVIAGSTVIKLVHLTELRSAINNVRNAAGMSDFAWTEAQPTIVRAIHIVEMRSALGPALSQQGRPVPSWTDTLSIGVPIKAIHIQQLRDATQFGATVVSGTITSNTTWTPSKSPYIVQGDVMLASGVTLTLLPGTIVKFRLGTGLYALGGSSLVANGTTSQPIVFTSIRDDSVGGDTNGDGGASSPSAGDWQTLALGSQDSQGGHASFGSLTNVVARYGTSLSVRFSAPTIQNVTSTHMSNVGLYLESPPATAYTIASLTLTFNPVNLQLIAVPSATVIQDSIIRGATYLGVLATSGTAARLVNNSIDDNIGVTNAVQTDGTCPLVLRYNSITNNRHQPDGNIMGVSGCCTQIDARSNWWGSTTGPDVAGQPDTGGGSQVGTNVLFDDWLGKPYAAAFRMGQHPWTLKAGVSTDVATGNFYLAESDLSIATTGFPLEIVRTYNNWSADTITSDLGLGWSWNYGTHLDAVANGMVWYRADGAGTFFKQNPDDTFSAEEGVYERLVKTGGTYRMTRKDQSVFVFDGDGKLSSETDANGNITVIGRDGSRRVTSVTDPLGRRSLVFQYSGAYVSSVTDPIGRVISYSHDGSGAITNITKRDQFGSVYGSEFYGYAGSVWQMTSFSDDNGNTLSQTFDSQRRVQSQQFDGLATIYFYYGSPTQASTTVQDTHGRFHIYEFGFGNNKVSRHKHQLPDGSYFLEDEWNDYVGYLAKTYSGLDGSTTSVYDWSNGDLKQVIEPGGRNTFYDYDQFHNVTRRTDNLGRATTYSYDAHQNLTHETNALGQLTERQYYPNGQIHFVIDARGNASSFFYDSLGYPSQVTNGANQATSFTYDAAGRKTAETDPLGNRTVFNYNGRDQLVQRTDPLGNQTNYAYDSAGRKVSMTDAEGRTTFYAYNFHNLLSRTTDARGGAVQSIYDDSTGNLVQVIDPNGHATTFGYDDLDRKITETDALNRNWHFEYVGRNRLSRVVDANGASTYHYYDPYNQLYQTNYPDGRTAFFGYDGVGNRTGLSDWFGSTAWGYDALNRPVGATRGSASVNYGYDASGNLSVLTYPNGSQVHYGYDAADRMTSVTDFSGRTTSYTYDGAGRLATTTYPNGVTGSRTYDASNRLSHIGYARSLSTLAAIDYSYDPVGNRLTRQLNGGLESYGYDELYRLTSALYPNGRSVYYSYDAAGNRTYQYDSRNGFGQNFYYDAANEAFNSSFGSSSYDLKGMLTTDGPRSYAWNGQSLLASAYANGNYVSFQYDGEGRRLQQTHSGFVTDYVVDTVPTVSRVLTETTNGTTTYYVYGRDLLYTVQSGVPHYLLADALGSTVSVTDANGQEESHLTYDVFGLTGDGSFGYFPTHRFTDSETDDTTLIYLRARYYDPWGGRFLSPDPIEPEETDTQSFNRYAYADNNPATLTDASGECPWCLLGAVFVGGGIGGVVGQWIDDRATHTNSSWTQYVGAFAGGGAAALTAATGEGVVVSSFVAALAKNDVTGLLQRMTRQPYSRDEFAAGLARDTLTGLIPGSTEIPYNGIFKQLTTKATKGLISRVAPQSLLKISLGRALNTVFSPGSLGMTFFNFGGNRAR